MPEAAAFVTALGDVCDVGDDERAPWREVADAAQAIGLAIVGARALGPDAIELAIAPPFDSALADASATLGANGREGAGERDGALQDQRTRARRLRHALLAELAARRPGATIDVAVQLARPPATVPRLLVMDMDSTVVTIEVIDELARRHGAGDDVAAITAAAMRGELDFEASLRARVARLAGLPAAVLGELAAALPFTAGVERLVAGVRALGGWTAIVSGGFDFAVDAAAARLGIDHAFANRLAIGADGRLTGLLVGDAVVPARKAELVGELAAAHGLPLAHTLAIGDGANDLLMLARAGLGVAFHGKPKVAAAADTSITRGGLDRVLYLLGLDDAAQAALATSAPATAPAP